MMSAAAGPGPGDVAAGKTTRAPIAASPVAVAPPIPPVPPVPPVLKALKVRLVRLALTELMV